MQSSGEEQSYEASNQKARCCGDQTPALQEEEAQLRHAGAPDTWSQCLPRQRSGPRMGRLTQPLMALEIEMDVTSNRIQTRTRC